MVKANHPNNKVQEDDSIFKKMFTPNTTWQDKDQFLDIIYWSRQVVAILMGFLWGFFGITGILGIGLFVALNSVVVYLYSLNYNSDNEDMMEYVKEGFMTAFAAFMVTWTVTYSALFFG